MGFLRFRRSFRVGPGLRVNLSKSGVSESIGRRGAWFTIGPRGTRTTVGLSGTGLSYTEQSSSPESRSAGGVVGWLIIAAVIIGAILAIVGLR